MTRGELEAKSITIRGRLIKVFLFVLLAIILSSFVSQYITNRQINIQDEAIRISEIQDSLKKGAIDHLKWKNELLQSIALEEKFNGKTDERECRFGKYYYEFINTEEYNRLPSDIKKMFKELGDFHTKVHQSAKKINEVDKYFKMSIYNNETSMYLDKTLEIINEIDATLEKQKRMDINKSEALSKIAFIIEVICYMLIILSIIAIFLFVNNSILKPLNVLAEHFKAIERANFTVKLPNEYLIRKDELGDLFNAISNMQLSIREIIENVKSKTNEVNSISKILANTSEEMGVSSNELASTMQQVADGATSQAGDLQDIVNLISNLTSNIERVYKEVQNVEKETTRANDRANLGKNEMDKLIKSIEEIKVAFDVVGTKVNTLTGSINQVSNIVNAIKSISEQTNLLSLNAAIEAAHAGDAGRGFAIVAEEVRKLADESKMLTNQINDIVNSIKLDAKEVIKTKNEVEVYIKSQTSSVENTVKSFADIIGSVENIKPLIDVASKEMDGIMDSKEYILQKVEAVSAIVEENTAATEEVAASSQQISASSQQVAATSQKLNKMASDLTSIVDKFKV